MQQFRKALSRINLRETAKAEDADGRGQEPSDRPDTTDLPRDQRTQRPSGLPLSPRAGTPPPTLPSMRPMSPLRMSMLGQPTAPRSGNAGVMPSIANTMAIHSATQPATGIPTEWWDISDMPPGPPLLHPDTPQLPPFPPSSPMMPGSAGKSTICSTSSDPELPTTDETAHTIALKIFNDPAMQDFLEAPKESCFEAAKQAQSALQGLGQSTQGRVVFFWRNPSDRMPTNHFVVLTQVSGKEYVVDPTAHQFRGCKPMFVEARTWERRIRAVHRDSVCAYQDFAGVESADRSTRMFKGSPLDFEGGTLMNGPAWYATMKRDVEPPAPIDQQGLTDHSAEHLGEVRPRPAA